MKPSERILQITNALKIIDNKKEIDDFDTYEAKAIAQYLDELLMQIKQNSVQ